MDDISHLRKLYGSRAFLTVFPNGIIIPWKPLTIQEYLGYVEDLQRQIYLPGPLENEIFSKCVLDDDYIRRINLLQAGIISTVVQNIVDYSGPSTVNPIEQSLNIARSRLLADQTNILHELVQLITMAFPYKPEEVYDMSYEILMLRAAQAEAKLLRAGVIDKPISLTYNTNNIEEEKPVKKRIDAKKLWDKQQTQQKQSGTASKPANIKTNEKWWDKSPVLEAKEKVSVADLRTAAAEIDAFATSGWEKVDRCVNQAAMVKDAQVIYKDLIKELDEKKSKVR